MQSNPMAMGDSDTKTDISPVSFLQTVNSKQGLAVFFSFSMIWRDGMDADVDAIWS